MEETTPRICPEHKTEMSFPTTFIDERLSVSIISVGMMGVTGDVLRMASISKQPMLLPDL
jgi:hypothetical protein